MKEEDFTDDVALANNSLVQFRSSVSQFSFGSTPSNPELRRSPRKPVPVRRTTDISPVKRLASESVDVKESKSSPKKQKRSYAPPETYAHLRELQDNLKPDLDVVNFASSPGKKSAEIGHHYGNPGNHFWWCLHQSGFTDTQLSPTEDFTLPDRFSIGLTDLVDRPTTETLKDNSGDEALQNDPSKFGETLFYAAISTSGS
ncbi:hypothetical protein K438DRAFT_1751654 [Mycena galopus ATCC 62051]|nr:hypothetical protein K438DRAFT_1751654 [Mycena galopus ATCC 62051]